MILYFWQRIKKITLELAEKKIPRGKLIVYKKELNSKKTDKKGIRGDSNAVMMDWMLLGSGRYCAKTVNSSTFSTTAFLAGGCRLVDLHKDKQCVFVEHTAEEKELRLSNVREGDEEAILARITKEQLADIDKVKRIDLWKKLQQHNESALSGCNNTGNSNSTSFEVLQTDFLQFWGLQ